MREKQKKNLLVSQEVDTPKEKRRKLEEQNQQLSPNETCLVNGITLTQHEKPVLVDDLHYGRLS